MRTSIPAERAALFLDFDGTLAAIELRPDLARPTAAAMKALRGALEGLDGRVAIVTGRALQEIDALLEGAVPLIAGSHGLERRTSSGGIDRPARAPELSAVAQEAAEIAAIHEGVLIEDKGLSIAIHYRQAPAHEAAVRAFAGQAVREGLELQHGHMVCEIRMAGADKGAALEAFLGEPPCQGATPIFVGDDLTDEAAFAAAARHGGFGVLVGPERRTAALGRLEDPDAVAAWIERGLASGAFEIGG